MCLFRTLSALKSDVNIYISPLLRFYPIGTDLNLLCVHARISFRKVDTRTALHVRPSSPVCQQNNNNSFHLHHASKFLFSRARESTNKTPHCAYLCRKFRVQRLDIFVLTHCAILFISIVTSFILSDDDDDDCSCIGVIYVGYSLTPCTVVYISLLNVTLIAYLRSVTVVVNGLYFCVYTLTRVKNDHYCACTYVNI